MKVFFIMLVCFLFLAQQAETSNPGTKIFKQNKQNYSLSNVNTWSEYPQLRITLQLAEAQLAAIGYVITIGSSSQTHLVTRLVVDGSEVEYYRAISGNTFYHTNAVDGHVFLSAGEHEIRVEYRTPGSFVSNASDDWTTAYLQVVY